MAPAASQRRRHRQLTRNSGGCGPLIWRFDRLGIGELLNLALRTGSEGNPKGESRAGFVLRPAEACRLRGQGNLRQR